LRLGHRADGRIRLGGARAGDRRNLPAFLCRAVYRGSSAHPRPAARSFPTASTFTGFPSSRSSSPARADDHADTSVCDRIACDLPGRAVELDIRRTACAAVECQSAFKLAPRSASNFDSLRQRAFSSAAHAVGLAGGCAETARAAHLLSLRARKRQRQDRRPVLNADTVGQQAPHWRQRTPARIAVTRALPVPPQSQEPPPHSSDASASDRAHAQPEKPPGSTITRVVQRRPRVAITHSRPACKPESSQADEREGVMAKSDTITQTVTPISWQQLCELRRQQLEAWKAAQPTQPAQFRSEGRLPPCRRTDGRRKELGAGFAMRGIGLVRRELSKRVWKRYRNFTCAMRRRAGRIISPDFALLDMMRHHRT